MGNSRCATIAAAYLMIKKDYSATQALQYMRNSRSAKITKMAMTVSCQLYVDPASLAERCSPTLAFFSNWR